jgi:multidrug efflux pump subunit AcrA (membrane-fusion protein)
LKDEGQSVLAGELLAVLDSTDLLAQRNQAFAQKSQGEANLAQTQAKYTSDQKSLRVLEIILKNRRKISKGPRNRLMQESLHPNS